MKSSCTPIRSGADEASSTSAVSYCCSPLPRKTNCASMREQLVAAEDEVEPLLRHQPAGHAEERDLRAAAGSPKERWSAALQRRLPSRLSRRVLGGDLRVGRRDPRLAGRSRSGCRPAGRPAQMNTSWRPKPPPGVRSSSAWVGLTVVTKSANASPPFRKLTLPYHSSCRQLYSSQGSPISRHHLGREVSLIAGVVDRKDRGSRRWSTARSAEVRR